MTRRWTHRALVAAAISAAPLAAHAQNILNPGAGGTFSWSTATWSLGTPPLFGGATQSLQFSNPTSLTYGAVNDLGSPFYLNTLSFNYAGGSATISSAPGNGLVLTNNGATNPTIQQLGAGSATIASGITLNAPLTIQGAGAGALSLTGVLRGTTSVTINRNATSVTTLSGANTHSGGMTLTAGILKLGDSSALGTGSLVINAGTLRVDSSLFGTTIANNILLNANLNYDTTSLAPSFGAILTGVLSGNGSINHSGMNTILQLSGANSYTGATNVSNGAILRINSAGNLGGGASSITLNGGTLSVAQLASGSVNITKSISIGPGGGTIGAFEAVLRTEVNTPMAGGISGAGQLVKVNNGLFFLNGANSHSGGTRIDAGGVVISADSALGSGSLVFGLSDGELISNAPTINRIIQLGTATATINANVATTISNVIQGSGLGFKKSGNATLTLTAANTQNAPVTVDSGTLIASGSQGRINDPSFSTGSPGLSLRPGAVVDLDNASGIANRIADGTHIALTGGSLILRGNSAANTNENVASMSFSGAGASTVTIVPGTGRNASITSARWLQTPTEGSTVLFRGTSLGSTPGANVGNMLYSFVNGGSLTGGGGAAGTTTINIIPFAVGDSSATGTGSSFVTYHATNGIRPLNTTTEYRSTFGVNAADNVRVTATQTLPASSNTTANALLVGPAGNVNLNGGTLHLTASAVLAAGGANTGIVGGFLNFGSTNSATIFTASDLTIAATVVGTQGISKSGIGTLRLNNTNVYSGATRVLEGTLRNNGGVNAIPDGSTVIINSGATLNISDTDETIGRLQTLNAENSFAVGNYGTVALGTRTLIAGGPQNSLSIDFFNGEMTGTGGFTKQGFGTQIFSGTQSYSGITTIQSGTLHLSSGNGTRSGAGLTSTSDVRIGGGSGTAGLYVGFGVTSFDRPITSVLGPATNFLTAGGTCSLGGALMLNKDLRVSGMLGGIGLNGPISGAAGLINLSGDTTIGLGNNSYTGTTSIHSGRVIVGANVPDGGLSPLGNSSGAILIGSPASVGSFDAELAINASGVTIQRFITTVVDANGGSGVAWVGNRATTGTGTLSGNITLNRATSGFYSGSHGSSTLRVTGPLLGNGFVLQVGKGFANSNVVFSGGGGTFAGAVLHQSGQLGFGADTVMSGPTVLQGPIGRGPLSIGGSSLGGSTTPAIYADGAARTIGNTINMNSDLRVTGTQPLTMTGTVTLGSTTRVFDVSNTGTTTLAGVVVGFGTAGLTKEGPGRLVLGSTNSYTGTTAVFAGTLGFGASQNLTKLRVGDGAVTHVLSGANKAIRMTSLDIASTGRVDLTDNDAIIDYTSGSPVATIYTKLQQGYSAGAWTGNGLTSSSAAAAAGSSLKTALGYAEATDLFTSFPATFVGQSVDSTSVLIRYTAYGDATLDGTVNGGDFNVLASNFGGSGKRWSQGDFTYDQMVNGADFNVLAANFGQGVPGGGDGFGSRSAVPEPGAILTAPLAALLLARRRR